MTESNIKAIFKFLSKGHPRPVTRLLLILFREYAHRKQLLGPQCSYFGALSRTGNEKFRTKSPGAQLKYPVDSLHQYCKQDGISDECQSPTGRE